MNELISAAEEEPTKTLKRQVISFWDEFGQIPPIKDVDMLFTAARSRGIRLMIALQSLGQLEERYSKAKSKTIKESCQITVFSYISPNGVDTATEFSKALGNYTTQSGSVSRGDKRSSSVQLIGRKLMMEDEIINMAPGEFIVMKSGMKPIQTWLKLYFQVFKKIQMKDTRQQRGRVKEIQYLTEEKIRMRTNARYVISPGQFDL
jgi:type IV secretion system protein VirD4